MLKIHLLSHRASGLSLAEIFLTLLKSFFTLWKQLEQKKTYNQVPLMPVRDKIGKYEAFLNNNADELQRKHGINMSKPSFIEQIHQQ